METDELLKSMFGGALSDEAIKTQLSEAAMDKFTRLGIIELLYRTNHCLPEMIVRTVRRTMLKEIEESDELSVGLFGVTHTAELINQVCDGIEKAFAQMRERDEARKSEEV